MRSRTAGAGGAAVAGEGGAAVAGAGGAAVAGAGGAAVAGAAPRRVLTHRRPATGMSGVARTRSGASPRYSHRRYSPSYSRRDPG